MLPLLETGCHSLLGSGTTGMLLSRGNLWWEMQKFAPVNINDRRVSDMVLVLQEVLVDELVAAVDTLQRYAVSGALQRLLGSLPAALASNAVRALGPWRPLLLPLPTPLELLNRSVSCPLLLLGTNVSRIEEHSRAQLASPEQVAPLTVQFLRYFISRGGTKVGVQKCLIDDVNVRRLQPAVKPTQQDEEVLASVRSIVELVQDQGLLQSVDASSSAQLTQLIRQVLPLLPELAPGLGYTGELLDRHHEVCPLRRQKHHLPGVRQKSVGTPLP